MKNRDYIKQELEQIKKYAFDKNTVCKIIVKLESDNTCQATKHITIKKGDLKFIDKFLKEYIK